MAEIERNRERGSRDEARIRNAVEARPKDTYYRPEYGWIMSDAQVAAEQKVKGQYDKAVLDTQKNITAAEANYQQSLAQGRAKINDAYSQAAKKNNVSMVAVRVVDGNKVEGTYMLPKVHDRAQPGDNPRPPGDSPHQKAPLENRVSR